MSKKKKPAYLFHKPSGQARVRIDRADHYLGPYGSPESRDRYDELIAEWCRPESHKTEHHDKDRLVFIGPRAQEIVREYLTMDLQAFLFSPRDAKAEFQAERRRNRRTPLTPSQRARKPNPNAAGQPPRRG